MRSCGWVLWANGSLQAMSAGAENVALKTGAPIHVAPEFPGVEELRGYRRRRAFRVTIVIDDSTAVGLVAEGPSPVGDPASCSHCRQTAKTVECVCRAVICWTCARQHPCPGVDFTCARTSALVM